MMTPVRIQDQGVYTLLVLAKGGTLSIGRLGPLILQPGLYAYTGSGQGRGATALTRRVARHLTGGGRLRWHIDYLLAHRGVRVGAVVLAESGEPGVECRVNKTLAGRLQGEVVARFGASDCQAGCGGHLLGLRLGLEEAARAVSNTYIRLGLNPRVILLGEGWGRRRARAVIYDLDGTLVEFRFDVAGSRRAVISRLEALGFDTRRLGPRTLTQEILEEVRRQTGRGGVRHPVEAVISLVDRELGRFELAAAERAEALPWTFEVVRETRRRGYATALVTNSGRAAVARVIDRLGLDPRLFDVVVTRNDVNNLKPAGEPLLKALEALGVPPGDALYVGDSVIDIGAARAAGVRVVSVASGLYPSEKLRAAGPDALIPSLWELLALL